MSRIHVCLIDMRLFFNHVHFYFYLSLFAFFDYFLPSPVSLFLSSFTSGFLSPEG